ncbi:hypothetical protein ACSSWA_11025 [Melioribacter sp. Ez-97]|jgi:hypothetical protein|uniref:hypothetical protein n=1 Tax=Melioribacter sp. Ez-97 TaxID=3423434 RepID=UPI003EDA1DEF
MKKPIKNIDGSLKDDILFCTECGEDLSQFGIDSEIDIEKVRERHANCRATGKFKGDKCAMIFIAQDIEDFLPDEDD